MTDTLVADDIHVDFQGEQVLRGVSLTVGPAETVAIVGPSGCGKSTLLMCLAGVLVPSAGSVSIGEVLLHELSDDDRAAVRADKYGFVMQFGDLVDELTLLENVQLAQMISGRQPVAATALLDRLGVGPISKKLPSQVSGGQRQRVAVARAVAACPAVLLADEPTGALDAANSEAVMDLLFEQAAGLGSTLIMVTHDERWLHRFDRVVRLRDGQVHGLTDGHIA